MTNKTVIMIVEDEKAICDFLKTELEQNDYRVTVAATGKEALSGITAFRPDLVLLDLGLPDMDGLGVLKSIRSWSTLPVIVVSARQQEGDIVSALDAGADDYITKPFINSVLLARVRTALRKQTAVDADGAGTSQVFTLGNLNIDYEKRVVRARGKIVHLTPIEYRILAQLSLNAGRVLTYKQILREVWGPYSGDNTTLRVNMVNLRRKVEENPADPRYILTEVGLGYRMAEESMLEEL